MTFKANWEKTYTKIHLSNQIITKILCTYYHNENNIQSISLIKDGCANLNFLVHLKHLKNPIILRIYLRNKASAYKEKKISDLLCHQLPIAKFYYVAERFNHTFAIIEYLAGKTLRDYLLTNQSIKIESIMTQVGKILGAIAKITFPCSGFFNENLQIQQKINRHDLIDFAINCLKNNQIKITLQKKQIKQIIHYFHQYQHLLPDDSENNLVHADFDPANLLVIEYKGEISISGILDWEFAFAGSSLCDVANMLRYAHKIPQSYQDSFLKGLLSTGYKLPTNWQITIHLLNCLALLECLTRSTNKPNQTQDIKELINHILNNLSYSKQ